MSSSFQKIVATNEEPYRDIGLSRAYQMGGYELELRKNILTVREDGEKVYRISPYEEVPFLSCEMATLDELEIYFSETTSSRGGIVFAAQNSDRAMVGISIYAYHTLELDDFSDHERYNELSELREEYGEPRICHGYRSDDVYYNFHFLDDGQLIRKKIPMKECEWVAKNRDGLYIGITDQEVEDLENLIGSLEVMYDVGNDKLWQAYHHIDLEDLGPYPEEDDIEYGLIANPETDKGKYLANAVGFDEVEFE